jgi:hypothetical protein
MTTAMPSQSDSIADLVDRHQAALELTDLQLANAIGYDRGLVVLMIKNRSMRLPINKVPALAKALQLDPVIVLRVALTEQSPELLVTLEEIFDPLRLTSAETNLIGHVRRLAAGRECAPIVFEGTGVIALFAAGQ